MTITLNLLQLQNECVDLPHGDEAYFSFGQGKSTHLVSYIALITNKQ